MQKLRNDFERAGAYPRNDFERALCVSENKSRAHKADPFANVEIGDEVGAVSGPGQSPFDRRARVVSKVEDRWGRHLDVKFVSDLGFEDGNSDTVHYFVTSGIGWYNLKEIR
jgi:hypothetical protein